MPSFDLTPRVVLEPPGGAVVIDPFADVGAGSFSVLGVPVPWHIAIGSDALPPPAAQLGNRLEGWLALGLVGLGAWWALSSSRRG